MTTNTPTRNPVPPLNNPAAVDLIVAGDSTTQPTGAADPANQPTEDSVYGKTFESSAAGGVEINRMALAELFLTSNQLRYGEENGKFYAYDEMTGLWRVCSQTTLRKTLAKFMVRLGRQNNVLGVIKKITPALMNSVLEMVRWFCDQPLPAHPKGLIHVVNGVVDLSADPALLPHGCHHGHQHSTGITFDQRSCCPQFLSFLDEALPAEDVSLLQRFAGSLLLGTNGAHAILLLVGTSGSGKSTLVTVLSTLIGRNLVAALRTQQLTERFEASGFVGKRLLIGAEIESDLLLQRGARQLKQLTGGDQLDAEVKFEKHRRQLTGDFHILIHGNRINPVVNDPDLEALRRRLLVVAYERPRPQSIVPDLAQKLVREEAAGILNWMIAGAVLHRQELAAYGGYRLTDAQTTRVNILLGPINPLHPTAEADDETDSGKSWPWPGCMSKLRGWIHSQTVRLIARLGFSPKKGRSG